MLNIGLFYEKSYKICDFLKYVPWIFHLHAAAGKGLDFSPLLGCIILLRITGKSQKYPDTSLPSCAPRI